MQTVAEKSILRAKEAYAKYYSSRKTKALKVIKHTDVPQQPVTVAKKQTCRATLMSGKPCRFPVFCNGLCKRHSD